MCESSRLPYCSCKIRNRDRYDDLIGGKCGEDKAFPEVQTLDAFSWHI